MNIFFQQFSKGTKTFLAIGIVLIVYGYLCRLFGIYFFWESRAFGWVSLLFAALGVSLFFIKKYKKENKTTTPAKITIGLIIFLLLAQIPLIAIIPFTDAYEVSKKFLINDSELTKKIGPIDGFIFTPWGSGISYNNNIKGVNGNVIMNLIVKGRKKYADLTMYVTKNTDDSVWYVENTEIDF